MRILATITICYTKGRIGHSKSKNGCMTCKIRRVKCGEEKPQCYRCTSTGRACEYKTGMAHDFRSWSGDSDCSLELRAFEYFFTRGALIFPGAANSRFWKTCVLQACQTEPVIWDAVISLSFLFEHPQYSNELVRSLRGGPRDSPGRPAKDRTHQQALTWYNRSLSKLRAGIERGTVSSVVALISCILYICIELLQDNDAEVVQLHHCGAAILSNCNTPLLEECIAPLLYNFSALAIFTEYVPTDKIIKPVSEAPDHFSKLGDAEVGLYRLLSGIVTHDRASAKARFSEGPLDEHRMAELEAQKDFLWAALGRWLESFQALDITIDGDASHAEKFAVAKLLQAHATLRAVIASSTIFSEMANDDLVDDFRDVVRYGRYALAATRYPDGTQSPFSLDTSIALPLFSCAIKCRDYSIRHEALRLLREAPKVQGLYKSAPHALMASKIVSIEEAGLELLERGDGMGPAMFIPESHRIFNFAVTCIKNDSGGQRWALKYSRHLPDDNGGYRIVEELSPFDSSDNVFTS